MPAPDFPDWTTGVQVTRSGSLVSPAPDFPDWTDGVTVIDFPLPPPGDVPDWTKVQVNVPGLSGAYPPTDSILWLDASVINGQADGSSLAVWPDRSSSHNNMSQATAAKQPTYYSSTAGKTINGLPAVWFDGTDDWMGCVTFPTTAIPFTLIVTHVYATISGAQYFMIANNLAGQAYLVLGNYHMTNGASFPGPSADTNLHTVTYVFNGTSSSIAVDNGAPITGSSGTNTMSGTLFVGTDNVSGFYLTGAICEYLLWARTLTGTEQTNTYNYLKAKWGTP